MDGDKKCPGDDFASVLSVREDRSMLVLRHRPDHTVEPAILRPVKDGESVAGTGLYGIKPRPDGNLSIETLYEPPAAREASGRSGRSGPAMVNSQDFRDNWDAIWGSRGSGGAVN